MTDAEDETTINLRLSTVGFDCVFSNDLQGARDVFNKGDSPFHMLGLGVCAFLEAALGMEVSAFFCILYACIMRTRQV